MHKILLLLFWLNACNAGYLFEKTKTSSPFNNLFIVKRPLPDLTYNKKPSLWNHKVRIRKKRLEYTISRKIDL